VGVRFCDSCNYREEVCPECGSEIVEAQSVIEDDPRPAILCLACGWHALIPAATPEAQTAAVDHRH
jgi:transcription initiation factor TFIIIB Brf1 subunit/transcription initiation factor TFIIB